MFLPILLRIFGKEEYLSSGNTAEEHIWGSAGNVMNTIPTIFNDSLPSYTAVGGRERRASTGLSAVILNREGHCSRFNLFGELEKAGFDYVISMEGAQKRYDLEALSGNFPSVRFILLKEPISFGEEINLAASELSSPLFFVLWNDLRILRGGGSGRMAERLLLDAADEGREQKIISKRLCTVPVIQDNRFETIPTLVSPLIIRGAMKTIPAAPSREGLPSLCPFFGIGIYDKERFIRLGGFDRTIKNFHWQLMDFGLRSHLWGEKIISTQYIKLAYDGSVPAEDGTIDTNYRRFFLKNLAPVFRGDYAHIPLRRFFRFFRHSGEDLFSMWEEFSQARRWVKTNRFRFKYDARILAELWDSSQEAPAPEGE
jgi:hypothetical protein